MHSQEYCENYRNGSVNVSINNLRHMARSAMEAVHVYSKGNSLLLKEFACYNYGSYLNLSYKVGSAGLAMLHHSFTNLSIFTSLFTNQYNYLMANKEEVASSRPYYYKLRVFVVTLAPDLGRQP